MSDNFYTNIQCLGKNILFRGIVNGRRVKQKVEFSPSLYIPTSRETGFKSLEGEYLQQKIFTNPTEARDFIKRNQDLANGSKVYGNSRFEYSFIADYYKGKVEWSQDKLDIAVIDIEVGSENGFPDPYLANQPITAITIHYLNGPTFVFGCGDYTPIGNERYIKCDDEWTLCRRFIKLWQEKFPDVLTGWNTKFFDIPYLVNRFEKILGEGMSKKLSPWGFITERTNKKLNKVKISYDLVGVSCLDYLDLYKWFAKDGKTQENYRLDTIANAELNEGKLSYEEYESLHKMYLYDFQKYIEYNIKDVMLIVRLEEKLKVLSLALTLAYDTKSNFEDVFTQTRMWDSLTYSYLLERGIVVPPKSNNTKDSAFEGAYVKEVIVGMHYNVASFDLDSLYPHIMMQYNISPETLIDPRDYTPEMRRIISEGVSVEKMLNNEIDTSKLVDVTLTPNGQFFRTDIRGFLPQMLDEMYSDRKKFKRMMLDAQQEYENLHEGEDGYELKKTIASYHNLQNAKKLSLNSAYGALGSEYFRFYDIRLALAVTQAGQLSIRWIENQLNNYINKILGTTNDYVIASDTDSIYLNLGPLINKIGADKYDVIKTIDIMDRICNDKIQPYIDSKYRELSEYVHAYEQKMKMKREALSDKGIWTSKKHYILNVYDNEGVRYKEPSLKIMGLEMVKSSTPSIIRVRMKELIKVIMSGTEIDAQDFIEQFRDEFYKLPPEDISFPRGMNGLDKWQDPLTIYKKGTPIHVKGAIIYNRYLQQLKLDNKYQMINDGEKLKFAYLKLPNPTKQAVIAYPIRIPPEMGLDKYIDYDTQYEKTFLEPVKNIMKCIGWKTEQVSSLESFFI